MNKDKIKRKSFFLCTIIMTVIYLSWRIFFTIPFKMGKWSLFFGLFLIIVEIIGFIELWEHFANMSNIYEPEKSNPPKEWYPDIDVFIATYNEPVELLKKTIIGCINMDYIQKRKVHIYLCDDGNREEMKALADKMGINYLTREEHKGDKAGNLNNALKFSKSPLIVTFDADMIPMTNFLKETVPYFYITEEEQEEYIKKHKKEKKIGFIQAPQCFYNPDLFQFNLFSERRVPNEQDYFYRDVQLSRNKTNSVIYGGSNTVISREALTEIEGFYENSVTEDFATGMLIQAKGYIPRCIYQPMHRSTLVCRLKILKYYSINSLTLVCFIFQSPQPIKTILLAHAR